MSTILFWSSLLLTLWFRRRGEKESQSLTAVIAPQRMRPWRQESLRWFGILPCFLVAVILVSAGASAGSVPLSGLGIAMFAIAVIFWRVGKRNDRDENDNARLVLVVEDDAAIQQPLVNFLQMQGFSVLSAKTAHEGIDALREYRVLASIVDLRLRGGTGRDVVVAMPPGVPVIVFPGVPSEAAELARLRPRTRVMERPYSLVSLVETIEGMLSQGQPRVEHIGSSNSSPSANTGDATIEDERPLPRLEDEERTPESQRFGAPSATGTGRPPAHHLVLTLPELGESIQEGIVLRVLVQPGDTIHVDEAVLEIETDTATIEVPSSLYGRVTEVKVKRGDVVKVGQEILTIDRFEVLPEPVFRHEDGDVVFPIVIGTGEASREVFYRIDLSAEQLGRQLREPIREGVAFWVYRNRVVRDLAGDAFPDADDQSRVKEAVLTFEDGLRREEKLRIVRAQIQSAEDTWGALFTKYEKEILAYVKQNPSVSFDEAVTQVLAPKATVERNAVGSPVTGTALTPSVPRRGLDKVAGMHALKERLRREVVSPVRDPEPYRHYRISIPNGILLYGPPGCGKTYIARQLAEELGYYFVEIIPSELASPYIHESVRRIRELFDNAAKRAPAIIFIDEFEALVPPRSELGGHQQHKAEEVNEFLAHLNNCSEKNVFVIAATNQPDRVDPAVRRTGRLDKLIYVGPPDLEARKEMLALHLEGRPVAASLEIGTIAEDLQGYSASDIRFLVDEAARAAFGNRQDITQDSFRVAKAGVQPSVTTEIEAQYQSVEKRGS